MEDKAKQRAFEAYPKKIEWVGNQWDGAPFGVNSESRVAYKQGYRQAEKDVIDNLWHDPDEMPEIERKIIFESETFLGKYLGGEWNPKKDVFGKKERWCYLADILPSKNWTGERPYSKVDYSRGYDNGYEQAEKELELTWEDIPKIFSISEQLKTSWWFRDNEQTKLIGTQVFWEEVLKRFNKQRNEDKH